MSIDRTQISKAYRGIYKKALRGKSLRSAVNAQSLECVCWHIQEIRNCSDKGCPLYAVRPYQEILQNPHYEGFSSVESTNHECR